MVYGKNSKNRAVETCNGKQMKTAKPKVISSEERIEELVIEIEERIDFLREMESMGKAKDYENIIKQEIARKYHELKKLDNNTAQKYVNFLYPAKKIEEKGRQNLGLKI